MEKCKICGAEEVPAMTPATVYACGSMDYDQRQFKHAKGCGSSAVISDCGKYRYELRRKWGEGSRFVNFIMLNPSTADASDDDPTIRRCIGFAKKWGYDGIIVTNLFAFRATSPKDLIAQDAPVGSRNDYHIQVAIDQSEITICAWGSNGTHRGRDQYVLKSIRYERQLYALRITPAGHPWHPLYLPGDLKPIKF